MERDPHTELTNLAAFAQLSKAKKVILARDRRIARLEKAIRAAHSSLCDMGDSAIGTPDDPLTGDLALLRNTAITTLAETFRRKASK